VERRPTRHSGIGKGVGEFAPLPGIAVLRQQFSARTGWRPNPYGMPMWGRNSCRRRPNRSENPTAQGESANRMLADPTAPSGDGSVGFLPGARRGPPETLACGLPQGRGSRETIRVSGGGATPHTAFRHRERGWRVRPFAGNCCVATAILGQDGVAAKPLWNADVGKELLPEEAESFREPDRTRGVGQQDVGRPDSAVRRRLCRVSPRCEEGSRETIRVSGGGVTPHTAFRHRERGWRVRPFAGNCCVATECLSVAAGRDMLER
jgi:hypothetical protein